MAEEWRQCVDWLVRCQILPSDHKAAKRDSSAFDLAQALRDGVLICHLLNQLRPGSVDTKDFSPRPQMSQFLSLKNIRAFLQTCTKVFGLREAELFQPHDLFDVKDFKKVLETLSKLSKTELAQSKYGAFGPGGGSRDSNDHHYYNDLERLATGGFPPDTRDEAYDDDDEDIYGNLPDLANENDLEDQEDIYDTVYQEDEDKIYDDLCYRRDSTRRQSATSLQPKTKRDYCLKELIDTEKNYVDALEMIVNQFIKQLQPHFTQQDMQIVFANIETLLEVHKNFKLELNSAVINRTPKLSDVFIRYKTKLLVYGEFCSNLPAAQSKIDELCQNESYRLKILECERKANESKFRLRDLLHVPMQRVLKYHLLMKELLKNTDRNDEDRPELEMALEAMQDLSLYVNEVKRDHEALQLIKEIQDSINDLKMPANTSLKDYGRFQKDGELKVVSHLDSKIRNRHIFLFDKVMLMCKARMVDKIFWGDTYNFKDAIILGEYKAEELTISNDRKTDKWAYPFMMAKIDKRMAFTFFAKTEDQRHKWMEAIALAHDNTMPAAAGPSRNYIMHTFEKPKECDVCGKLLRGIFFQGYLCQDNAMAVHKECIGKQHQTKKPRPPRPSVDQNHQTPYKGKAVQTYKGLPSPPAHLRPVLTFDKDQIVDVIAEPNAEWSKGRCRGEEGYFPSRYVVMHRNLVPMPGNYEEAVVSPVSGRKEGAMLMLEDTLNGTDVSTSQLWYYRKDIFKERKDSYVVVPGDRVSGLPPPPAPHSVRNGPDYVNDPNSLQVYNWYVGEMERTAAQRQLDACPDGTFLIRVTNNPARKGELSLSIKYANAVRHIKVNRTPQGRVYLADGRYFDSVQHLVDYYEHTELADSFPDVATTLRIPYKTVATGRILGYAMAVYDYAATSTSQVTLKLNDRIAILSKNGQDKGWWKGENLRTKKVGYFPLAYVDEIDEEVL